MKVVSKSEFMWILRIGRIWNFHRIEYRIEYPRHFEYESNIKTNSNIQWLQIDYNTERYRYVLPGRGVTPCRSFRQRGHTHRFFVYFLT